uniref:Uncharacterized protein n=1 Tax=Meloidogyne enterolobii TaxID=390850 RepID=A0A6V7WGZ7_MELEN|nr:unnamed protein product [Meloidogyne enterolobii]
MTHIPVDLDKIDWGPFLAAQEGGAKTGLSNESQYFQGTRYQRGFGVLGTVGRFLMPIVKNLATSAGQEAVNVGKNVLEDVSQGRSVSESLKKHSSEGLQKVGKKLQQCGKGKRKRIQRSAYKEILPLNALNQSAGPFIFRYFGDSLYLDLSKTFLSLILSLERKDVASGEWIPISDGEAADLKGDKFAGVVQYLGLTWIRRLTLSINGIQCYDSGIHYAYRCILLHELGADREVSKGIYEAALYYKDAVDKDDFEGSGFKSRASRFAKGKLCRMFSHLDYDMARQNQLLIPHSDVIWTIYRNSDEFLIHTPKLPFSCQH